MASNFVGEYYEIAISGKETMQQLKEINQHYIPNKLITVSTKNSIGTTKNKISGMKEIQFLFIVQVALEHIYFMV